MSAIFIILVGMILKGKLAVGRFYFSLSGSSFNAKNFVAIIAFCWLLSTMRVRRKQHCKQQ
jgi:hypothetical protein